MMEHCVFLAAGGTGGHLFPAESLAIALQARGIAVELATDDRALRYGSQFPAQAIHTIPAATPRNGSLIAKGVAALTLLRGVGGALLLLRQRKPACVVGFGGYPTVPPVLAASLLGIPTIIHDQNAVLGKANRFLSGRVDAIGCGFPEPGGVPQALRARVHVTGNPVRPSVLEAAQLAYPSFDDQRLRLLITGGSQGAKVMSDIVPAAIELLTPEQRARLVIVQQARGEDEQRVREAYQRMGLAAEVAPFFKDLPQRIAQAHLVIARAGASTVSELAVIGRPAILVPFPFALDQDQAANARQLEATGAVDVVAQTGFTPQWLAQRLEAAMNEPERLKARAAAAKAAGVPDAASRLADLVQSVMARATAETAK